MATYIHESAWVSPLAAIDVSRRGTHTFIGEQCVIDDFVKIKHVGGSGDVKLGKKVYINSGTVLYSGNGLLIGDHVAIGPNCSITPVNHEYRDPNMLIQEQGFTSSKGGILIEEDVWIGAGVTILDGAHIKKGAVIGAHSLVLGTIEAYSINYGIPCKAVAQREQGPNSQKENHQSSR